MRRRLLPVDAAVPDSVCCRDLKYATVTEIPGEVVKHFKAFAKQNTVMHQVSNVVRALLYVQFFRPVRHSPR